MKAMATYVMRGRLQAIMVIGLFAVLSMMLPPLSYISGGALALVALRKGQAEGAIIALIASALLAVISFITMGNGIIALVYAVVVWLPILLLSMILRSTISLGLSVVVAASFSIIALLGFHLAVGNTVEWWDGILAKMLEEAARQQGMDMMSTQGMLLENASQLMTAIMAAAFFTSMVISLMLGRWWQSLLYNPGGFQQEFHQFRLDKVFASISALVLLWAVAAASMGSLAMDAAFVVCACASIAGIALIHHWVKTKQVNKAWLILLYLLLAFIAPQILLLLAILGFADAWLDFRKFYQNKTD